MLSLWLLVFCSATPIAFPAMADNYFSGESPDEIYSGAFPQLVWTRFVFVPLWRCLITSSSDLSAYVKLSIAIACFSCLRSFQCTDLNSHRLLPSSSAPCPMNHFPKGITSSALLWCEPDIRSGSCSSDLASFENLGFSTHDVQSARAMEYLFADLQIPLPPLAYFVKLPLDRAERDLSPSPPYQRRESILRNPSIQELTSIIVQWVV
ncbi:hypothetical protein YC2023_121121 [Brassica napus]